MNNSNDTCIIKQCTYRLSVLEACVEGECTQKVRFFLWLASKEALPTNNKRHHNHLMSSAACIRCRAAAKDAEHVLRRCPGSVLVWSKFSRVVTDVPTTVQFRAWLFTHLVHHHALLCAIVWNLWKWRNSFVFKQEMW